MEYIQDIYKTMVTLESRPGDMVMYDTIFYKGEPWLVLSWRETPDGEPTAPERIIRLGAFPHQEMSDNYPTKWLVHYPLPEQLFLRGSIPSGMERDIIDNPQVSVRIGRA